MSKEAQVAERRSISETELPKDFRAGAAVPKGANAGAHANWSRRAALAGLGGAAVLAGVALTGTAANAAEPDDHSTGDVTSKDLGIANVRDFGARGDGKTDDTKAFQSALDTVAKSGSVVVVVPPGTYPISATLNATGPVRLVGLGGWSSSELVIADAVTTGISLKQASTANVYPGPALQLIDLSFSYAGTGSVVVLDESALHSPFQDTLISGCRFFLGADGTAISSINQRSLMVTECQFLGAHSGQGTAIRLDDSDNTTIQQNVFYHLGYCVYGVRGANRTYDAGIIIMTNSMSSFNEGIYLDGWETVQAIGNMIDGCATSCIHMIDGYHSIISNNYLGVTAGSGLLLETKSPYGVKFEGQVQFTSNYFNCYQAGGPAPILLNGVSAQRPIDQVNIVDNIVNGHPQPAVQLNNAQNVRVSGNTFRGQASGLVSIIDKTPGKNYIYDNIVDGDIQADGDMLRDNWTLAAYPS